MKIGTSEWKGSCEIGPCLPESIQNACPSCLLWVGFELKKWGFILHACADILLKTSVLQFLPPLPSLLPSSLLSQLYSILEDLNAILDNTVMGGGSVGGHGLVLAMHMLKEQQSFTKFRGLLTDNFSHLCDCINCLQPFNKALTQVGKKVFYLGMLGEKSPPLPNNRICSKGHFYVQ